MRNSPIIHVIEAGHCIRVLRLGEGDEIVLTDGQGSFYKAAISRAHPQHCEVTLLESWKQPDLWNFNLHIAIAPTKNMDRMEWFVEKATEIGINAITCLNCRFSERKEIKPIRLEKILVSAMKQSQKATLPALEGMTDFKKFAGGFHFQTPLPCIIVSTLVLLGCLLENRIILEYGSFIIHTLLVYASIVPICILSPIDSKNRQLSAKEKSAFHRKTCSRKQYTGRKEIPVPLH